MIARLRYTLDRIAAWITPHCPDDWSDEHLDFEICQRCARISRRNERIARYRIARRLPEARVKVIVP